MRRHAVSRCPSPGPRCAASVVCLVTLVLAVFLLPADCDGADCIDYEKLIHPMGGVSTIFGQWLIAVSENHAYVSRDYEGGLHVIDISDPDHPRFQGYLDVGGRSFTGIAAQGDYAYAMQYEPGRPFYVIDVADPGNPHIVGSVGTGTTSWGVAVSGAYAYVGYGTGILVIDVSDPTLPTIVADLETPGGAWAVTVSGERLYGAAWHTGLVVIDISVPENPQLMGIADTPGRAWVVSVSGTLAYVGEYHNTENGGFCVVDVADPYNPRLLGSLDDPGSGTSVYSIAALGSRAYITTGDRLHVVDVSDPENPSIVATMAFPPYYYPNGAAVTPTACEHKPHVYVSGSVAYDPLGSTGWFQVVGISDLNHPEPVGSVGIPCRAYGIAVEGSHAYIANWDLGLQVVDVTDPNSPVIVGSVDTPYDVVDVAVAGRYAYVSVDEAGIQVIDVGDPEAPQIVGGVDTPGRAWGIAVSDPYLYVAAWDAGLQIVNVSNPQDPEIVAALDTPGSARDVTVRGDFAYVADGDSGVRVISIANPEMPLEVGVEPTGAYDITVNASGGHVYTTFWSGLHVIDVSDPTDPWRVSTTEILEGPSAVAASRSHVYVTSSLVGLQVLDVSDPFHPRSIGYADMTRHPYGIAVSGSHVFVVDMRWCCPGSSSLRIYPSQCEPTITPRSEEIAALSTLRLFAFPNPAIGGTDVRLSVPVPGTVRAAICDVGGRRIRSLFDGILPVGPVNLRWDGRDHEGRSVAAGIYWVRVTSVKGSASERLVVLR